MTKVTAIIPSLYHVDGAYLKLCVESLRATTPWDIIVVTNGTPAPEPLPFGGVTNRLHTRDQGQCNAVNIGVQAASPTTDYFCIINSDMYFAPNWNKYLRFDYPVFSPNLMEPVNNAGSAKPFVKMDGGNDLESFKKIQVDHVIEEYETASHNTIKEETGFNLPFFIRKDVYQTIGGYDTAYDPWGSNSDTDLQTAINLAGITPMRLRDVIVYHFSNKSGTFQGHQDFYQNNWEYFHSKWGFDRDELKSDVWYNKDMLPEDKSKINFKPKWAGKYARPE